ncbi:lipoyl(octanoyl) transferase LipB [Aureispira anguillae]|uniref:Octanoyltransferase n=1 Tax=Aureispira anguillae TaxID=2864201 RepID=A0A915YBJ1_9BACT|nr:lipoyl(octanoyl) transferase LipB [Aureispira anguillae]BDS10052.1 lipoyl(octanoyl) transferase LipB [Aureispira anguillae]
MGKEIIYKDLGVIPYTEAWDLQTKLFEEVVERKLTNRKLEVEEQQEQFHYLLFCEHPHVYTLGRNGKEAHLLLNEATLSQKNATFHKINRGGDITYHGYGQLVGYPILDLDEFFTDIGRYVRLLEEAIIRMLAEYQIVGERIKGLSGVWIGVGTNNPRKICAVGVHLSRWTTMHGFALNVNTDLTYFRHIVPCGIDDKAVTSMEQELGQVVDLDEVKEQLKRHFADLFEANYK